MLISRPIKAFYHLSRLYENLSSNSFSDPFRSYRRFSPPHTKPEYEADRNLNNNQLML